MGYGPGGAPLIGVDQHPQAYAAGHGGMPLQQQPYDMNPDQAQALEGANGAAAMGKQGPMPGGRSMPPHMQMMHHQQQQFVMSNPQM